MLKKYAYSQSIAIGGDNGIIILSVKINEPSVEEPNANIEFIAMGEGGMCKAVISDLDFLATIKMFMEKVAIDLKVHMPEIEVKEKAMLIQNEMFDPEKMKQKMLMDFMIASQSKKVEVKENVPNSVNSSTGVNATVSKQSNTTGKK